VLLPWPRAKRFIEPGSISRAGGPAEAGALPTPISAAVCAAIRASVPGGR
jgi:hypothetical protein